MKQLILQPAGSNPANSEAFKGMSMNFIVIKLNMLPEHCPKLMNRHFPLPAVMAERLRRWTRNPMGFPCAGSNPAHSEAFECVSKNHTH